MSFSTNGIRALTPGYFALVMATGIVSIAAENSGCHIIAHGLLWLNVGQYLLLGGLTLARWRYSPREFRSDLSDHQRGPGFFTLVAGTGVLAEQLILLQQAWRIALGLWGLALLLWATLTYTIFTALTVKTNKPPLDRSLSGNWLLAVVATQAIAVLTAQLASRFGAEPPLVLNFLALTLWLSGGMGYGLLITLIFYRCLFFKFSPTDFSPHYWINMGAAAISTLAGSALIESAAASEPLGPLLPFLKGMTLLFWACGTWWLPLLALLAVWRYGYHRSPLTYDPAGWSVVFPLGMYATCTFGIARTLRLDFLLPAAHAVVYLALTVWALTFSGMLHRLVKSKS